MHWEFRDRKETDVLRLICSVSLIAKTIGILEDEDDDEHEDEPSISEFRFKRQALPHPTPDHAGACPGACPYHARIAFLVESEPGARLPLNNNAYCDVMSQ